MPNVIEIPCPNCQKQLKVPETVFGKKIKCKHCGEPFRVDDPDARDEDDEDEKPRKTRDKSTAVKPSKPGVGAIKPKPQEPKKEEPKPAATYGFAPEEEEGATPNPLGVVDEGQDIPRCPHCAAELDPPDAVVCINCGFNTVTRTKAESKKVWAPDFSDWMSHLGPGIGAAIVCITLIVVDIIIWINMRDWLTGTFLESDDPDPTNPDRKKLLVKPGAFIALAIAVTIMPIIVTARFAIKRLAFDYKPREREKK